MSIEKIDSKQFITIKITGLMIYADQEKIQQAGLKAFEGQEKLRILVIFENFQGWDNDPRWNNLSFQAVGDQHITKMAVVCDESKHDEILMFLGDGFRSFPIQAFKPNEIELAQAWLSE